MRVSSTLFLNDASLSAHGWLLAVMRAVEAVSRPEFTLDDVYAHKATRSALYPGNRIPDQVGDGTPSPRDISARHA